MPRVKIDYVVSFSSESPEAPANNLLVNDAGKGRWLCSRGEPSCSVLLQLTRAVQISSISIGAHHAALVEVLVGKSETPNEPFQVLIASSVFLSPLDSRRVTEGDAAADRVRTFNTEQLAADIRNKRWDRLRVVCSQPYNKHCKYGLSFIHIFSPEADATELTPKTTANVAKPAINIPLGLDVQDSDDDEFKPGALFAKHRAASQEKVGTDAQIRQATSNAFKNKCDSSSKIVRTPIAKPRTEVPASDDKVSSDRRRERLMYADEDNKPHNKIDKLVAAHKDEQAKNSAEKTKEEKIRQKDIEKANKSAKDKQEASTSKHEKDKSKEKVYSQTKDVNTTRKDHHKEKESLKSPQSKKRERSLTKQDEESNSKKQKVAKDQDAGSSTTLQAGPVSESPHTLLSDVVFVLSGYENPRRAAVRDAALAMGAVFQRDWGPTCTHLICAFPNTPKLKTVLASPNGKSAVVVTAEWVERCAARRRRLPWQWFATDTRLRVPRARAASAGETTGARRSNTRDNTPESECDTDDEIEKALQKQKALRNKSPAKLNRESLSKTKQRTEDDDIANSSRSSDVAFVMDERIKGNVTVSDSDTDDTEPGEQDEETLNINEINALPSFFEGQTFALHSSSKPLLNEALVRRYVRAYGGEIVEATEEEEVLEVDYVLCLGVECAGDRARGRCVRADWLWRCHESGRAVPSGDYELAAN